tara:strand:- start:6713 stop:7861 length:1149 start_codon:yes stop_codon:yes gene_type:complete
LDNLLENYSFKLANKNIGLITNHTGIDKSGSPNWEILQTITGTKISAIFSPEHGFSGAFAAGESVSYESNKQNITFYSLYGKTRKPTPQMLDNIDMLIYDIQDIGVRFYTYITTLGLVLEAAGEMNIPVIILDRVNPIKSNEVSGPVLKSHFKSFVGFYPIPTVYGMTPGELAQMIIGEKWIDSNPFLEVIKLINWKHQHWFDETELKWINPSPNIPDLETALIYHGLCLIEATNVSEGRGTDNPFRWVGAPWINGEKLSEKLNGVQLSGVEFNPVQFTPINLPGKAVNPKYENELCQGISIHITNRNIYDSIKTGVSILTEIYSLHPDNFELNQNRMNQLWGSDYLANSLKDGLGFATICKSYLQDLEQFEKLRSKYLLYE